MNSPSGACANLVSRGKEIQLREPSASEAGRKRLLSVPGEPLFIADWERVLMLHYEVDRARLQAAVPFELDVLDGRAFVTVVAFTLRGLRLFWGGPFTAWLTKPIATHEFLNVRTYVRHGAETGIYFMREWLSNRFSVALGPRFFGLPYQHGRIEYRHEGWPGVMSGSVRDTAGRGAFSYRAAVNSTPVFEECQPGTLTEWLMERYTAFTFAYGKAKFFRVWHEPWTKTQVEPGVTNQSLLEVQWPLFREAAVVSADYSPGVKNVWMGRPHGLSHPGPVQVSSV